VNGLRDLARTEAGLTLEKDTPNVLIAGGFDQAVGRTITLRLNAIPPPAGASGTWPWPLVALRAGFEGSRIDGSDRLKAGLQF
jgi:hypothetical protein